MTNFSEQNLNLLFKTFFDLQEGILAVDENREIIYINKFARDLFGNIKNIKEIEPLLSFDICILKEGDILKYNPITASFSNEECFKTQALFEISHNKYRYLNIKTINIRNYKIFFIFDNSSNIQNTDLTYQLNKYLDQIQTLTKHNKEFSSLKEQTEIHAIRVGLINKISASIRDTLDIEEIIQTSITEISLTLGTYRGIFAKYNASENCFKVSHECNFNNIKKLIGSEIYPEKDMFIKDLLLSHKSQLSIFFETEENISGQNYNNSKPRLICPVIHQGEILGIMIFMHSSSKKNWHPEEISLIENIATQVGSAIFQASLFEKLEKEKMNVEFALKKLKETQTQLIQSEKMASLGQLVAGVAHEINTPMGSLNSNINLLIKYIDKFKEKLPKTPDTAKFFNNIDGINKINIEAIKRINTIIKSLKNFARLDEAEYKEVEIHEGIKSTLMIINHEIKNRITIVEDFAELPLVKCFPNLLNQVFMNIIVNGYQSIEGKGTIIIKTEKINDKVRISFTDSGKGISEEHLAKIFDPGFTTKGVGVGTGLGLSICYQIIEKHNGTIKAFSNNKEGSTFEIELPLC